MTFKENLSLVDGLKSRVSHPRLIEPAPIAGVLAECYKAAFRSPDHAWLRPWRFIECRGDERVQLGQLVADAMRAEKPDLLDTVENKFRNGPLRAPLVILCIADIKDHPKVPVIEQKIAVGCAVNNMITALYGYGFGAVWRTGDSAYSQAVHQTLRLQKNQVIVGYLYVGSKAAEDKDIPQLDQRDFVQTLTDHLSKPLFLQDNP